jgi:malate dehydrogenase (oxaloacetate-decarboxylating)
MKNNLSQLEKKAVSLHRRFKGKLQTTSLLRLRNKKDLSLVYTPGVAAISSLIAENKKEVCDLTWKNRSVAVISDGSAVLGLGNVGPEAALPVMEGKCVIFKEFANIDAVPIVLNTQDTKEIIKIVKAIAPGFGAINLEDISAPRCFEIENRLKEELDIPVMHDDQHGTAIVVLAGLINALRVVKKRLPKARIIVNGAGPAGTATAKLLVKAGAKNVVVLDSKGIIYKGRKDLVPHKKELAEITNPKHLTGDLNRAIWEADVFIGLSRPNLLMPNHIKMMSRPAIVFALANPVPEIMPNLAWKAGAKVVATGRSDFSNQINNSLVFPGIFRGALDNRVSRITDEMKLRAAFTLARLIKKPTPKNIIPSIFDKRVVKAIAKTIR